MRISCPALSCAFNEHHAFSLASAPQAQTLALFIKAVGPWTWSLRNEITEAQENGLVYPVLNLDGPYGDGNQVKINERKGYKKFKRNGIITKLLLWLVGVLE